MMKKSANVQTAEKLYDRTYDKSAKSTLAVRQFLAFILHERVPEFRPFTREVIERDCIEKGPWVGEIPVDPGKTNKILPQKIRGQNTEQSDEDEGTITYDILFYARVPGSGKRIKLLINIEAQRNATDYDLYHRAWFYLTRLVSSQKERDFTGQDYDSICKVYSIWLCFYLPEGEESSITRYGTQEDTLVGNHSIPKNIYGLFNIIMIHVGDDENSDTLLKFLRTVFLAQLTENELAQKLKNDFGIEPNEETRKELTNMCNLSAGFRERAEAKGKAKGKAEGEATTWLASARNLMKNLKLTAKEAVDAVDVPEPYRAKVLEQL